MQVSPWWGAMGVSMVRWALIILCRRIGRTRSRVLSLACINFSPAILYFLTARYEGTLFFTICRLSVTAQVPPWRAQVGIANQVCGRFRAASTAFFGTRWATGRIREAYLGSYDYRFCRPDQKRTWQGKFKN